MEPIESLFEKLKDVFLFREGTEDDNNSVTPVVTIGSIVWGVMLRSIIIITISLYFLVHFGANQYYLITLSSLWFLVAWPAWRQYSQYYKRMEDFKESTLCGSCIHFEPNSQLCKIYDEHVSKTHIPCEGMAWQPKQFNPSEDER